MPSMRTYKNLVKTNSKGKYYSTANLKQNFHTLRQENSLHEKFWKQTITTTVIFECVYTVLE